MKTLSTERMRAVDKRCIEGLGLPGVVLMNNAGQAVFQEVRPGPVGIVCGKGNNGGDGFVVARLALAAGQDVRLVLLTERAAIKGDAATFMHVFERLGGRIVEAPDAGTAAVEVGRLKDCKTLVDAMLGTGATGAIREPMHSAIRAWPHVFTVAVDIPSGLNGDTGTPGDPCLKADVTVTLHAAKAGFTKPTAQAYLGKLVVADIGIPPVCEDDEAWARLGFEV